MIINICQHKPGIQSWWLQTYLIFVTWPVYITETGEVFIQGKMCIVHSFLPRTLLRNGRPWSSSRASPILVCTVSMPCAVWVLHGSPHPNDVVFQHHQRLTKINLQALAMQLRIEQLHRVKINLKSTPSSCLEADIIVGYPNLQIVRHSKIKTSFIWDLWIPITEVEWFLPRWRQRLDVWRRDNDWTPSQVRL